MYFSRTFKALNFDFQIQGLSRTFKGRANPELIRDGLSLLRRERPCACDRVGEKEVAKTGRRW